MIFSLLLSLVLALSSSCVASSILQERQDTKVGYFLTSFPVDDEAIYMHLSNGNNPHSYRRLSLNGTEAAEAILRSNVGTKGVRDSHIIQSQDKSKFWLIATDLNANFYNNDFNAASRFGSRSIVIWESNDLANWSGPRLSAPIAVKAAGNVWAPEGYWDPLLNAYIIVFASRIWSDSDPQRTGKQPGNQLLYTTTKNFVDFSESKVYFAPGYPVIDATFLNYPEEGPNVWYRFVKSEVDYMIFQQKSTNGILGTWTNVGGAPNSQRIEFASQYSNNEGPLIFRDNQDPGLFHLWIDENTLQTYIPGQARTLNDMKAWTASGLSGFPQRIKHGVVHAVNQQQYNAIQAKYKVVS